MSEFAYSHSRAIVAGLVAFAYSRHLPIGDGYQFVEEDGGRAAFDRMIEIIRRSEERDIVFVDTIKEFAGTSLADFKARLKALNDANVFVRSSSEPNYDYWNTLAVIEVVESLLPIYRQANNGIIAATLHMAGMDVKFIREHTGLSEAEIYQAIADCKRAYELSQRELDAD